VQLFAPLQTAALTSTLTRVVVCPIVCRITDSYACVSACQCGEGHFGVCNQVEYSFAQPWKLGLTCSGCHTTVFSATVAVAVAVAAAAAAAAVAAVK